VFKWGVGAMRDPRVPSQTVLRAEADVIVYQLQNDPNTLALEWRARHCVEVDRASVNSASQHTHSVQPSTGTRPRRLARRGGSGGAFKPRAFRNPGKSSLSTLGIAPCFEPPKVSRARGTGRSGAAHPLPKPRPTAVDCRRLTSTSGESDPNHFELNFRALACKVACRLMLLPTLLEGFESLPLCACVSAATPRLSPPAAPPPASPPLPIRPPHSAPDSPHTARTTTLRRRTRARAW
jgi:hypothetical protein